MSTRPVLLARRLRRPRSRGAAPAVAMLLAGAAAVAAWGAAGVPTAAAAVPTTPYGNHAGSAVLPDRANAQAQCDRGVTAATRNDAALAAQIMRGRVAIEKYGTVVLAANPTWKPQSGLDTSGDAHMHSLHYLVPLLREGERTQNAAMINRFYGLLRDWSLDNRPGMKKPPNVRAWQPLYTGYRMQVINCALAGPRGGELWLRQLAAVHANYVASYTSKLASNNTGIQLAMGQLVIGCSMHNAGWTSSARSRLSTLAGRLVLADGSTNEGAVSYARSDYSWFRLAGDRLQLCRQARPAALTRVDRIPTFVAQSIRPDGRYEALGDTSPDVASASPFTGTVAQFAASAGAGGPRPSATFSVFRQGGFVFGRSGWGTAQRPFAAQTFYSVRAGKGPGALIFHAHADAGSVTLFANGAERLYDVGQWRYQSGSVRNFVVGRTAHNVVSAAGLTYSTSKAPGLTANSTAARDLVTVWDYGYRADKVALTRTVVYSRAGEYLVVWDTASSSKRDTKKHLVARTFTQNWQLGPGTGVALARGRAATTGAGAGTVLQWLGRAPSLSAVKGKASPRAGWVSTSYGSLTPATAVRAVQRGTSASWVTVVVPRGASVPAATVTARARSIGANRIDLEVTNGAGVREHVVITRGSATLTRLP